MKLRVDRCGPPKGRMMIKKDSEAPSYLDGLVSRMTKKGMKKSIFTKPQASAATRWGTRYEGQWQLDVNGRGFAAGFIHAAGDGTLEALKQGAAAPFQACGFQVNGSLRTAESIRMAKRNHHCRSVLAECMADLGQSHSCSLCFRCKALSKHAQN